MRVTIFFVVAFALTNPAYCLGETIITGPLSEPQIWTQAGSPYIIQGEVYTNDGISLEIEPGVSVLFETDASLSVGYQSTFVAQGTASAPILFSSNSAAPQPGDYIGLSIPSEENSTLAHCEIEFADAGLFLLAPLAVEDVEIHDCIDGLRVAVVQGDISGFNIHDNTGHGIYCAELTWAIFKDCVVADNGGVGILASMSNYVGADHCLIQGNGSDGMLATTAVTNCTINDNGGIGLILVGGTRATHNTIVGNSGYGVGVRGVSSHENAQVNWCNIYDNGEYDFAVTILCNRPTIDATNNFWGTQDEGVIGERILDVNDDANLISEVVFAPFEGAVGVERESFGSVKSMYR